MTELKKSAKVQILDMKEDKGIYLFSIKIKAGIHTFTKAVGLQPVKGLITVQAFKDHIRELIKKELEHRKAIEPIKNLKEDIFVVEYD